LAKLDVANKDVARLGAALAFVGKVLDREVLEGSSVEERIGSLIAMRNTLKKNYADLAAQNLRMKEALNTVYGKVGRFTVASPKDVQRNGAVVCDALDGECPCACGAWHVENKVAKAAEGGDAEVVLRGILDRMGMGSVGTFEGALAIETALSDLQKQVRELSDANEQLRQNSSESVYRQLRKMFGMGVAVNSAADVYEILRKKDNNERVHRLLDEIGVKKGLLYHRVKLLADALSGIKGAFESGEE